MSPRANVQYFPRFVAEARNKGRKHYSPTSLQGLLAGLLRYMRERNVDTPNFLNKKDLHFRELHAVMERVFCDLRKQGIGAEVKHTSIISPEEENQL